MSNRFSLCDFGHLISIDCVVEWLKRNGWSVQPDGRGGLLCRGPADDDGNPVTRTLPEQEGFLDYGLRLEDLIATIATLEERPAIEIVKRIADTRHHPETRGTTPIDEMMSIIHDAIGGELLVDDRERILAELTPILSSVELAANQRQALEEFGGTQEAALFAVRLARILPRGEGAKLAIWRVCSRVLSDRLALNPWQLDQLYSVALADDVDAPDEMLMWLRDHLTLQQDLPRRDEAPH